MYSTGYKSRTIHQSSSADRESPTCQIIPPSVGRHFSLMLCGMPVMTNTGLALQYSGTQGETGNPRLKGKASSKRGG